MCVLVYLVGYVGVNLFTMGQSAQCLVGLADSDSSTHCGGDFSDLCDRRVDKPA
jgi:hypothetical protein